MRRATFLTIAIAAMVLPLVAADAQIASPGPAIIAPDEAAPGTLVTLEAAVPEGCKLIWAIDPPHKDFVIDTSGQLAYLTSANKGVFKVWLSVAGTDIHALVNHKITFGDAPDPPDPDPGPDPPDPDPTPGDKLQIMMFIEAADQDNYTADQRVMLDSYGFQNKVKANGHIWHGVRDLNSGEPSVMSGEMAPWWQAAKGKDTPLLCIALRDKESQIKTYPLPKTLDELYQIIGGLK